MPTTSYKQPKPAPMPAKQPTANDSPSSLKAVMQPVPKKTMTVRGGGAAKRGLSFVKNG